MQMIKHNGNTLYIQSIICASGPSLYSLLYRDPTLPHKQALGYIGKEKLPFNKKHKADLGSIWVAMLLDQLC